MHAVEGHKFVDLISCSAFNQNMCILWMAAVFLNIHHSLLQVCDVRELSITICFSHQRFSCLTIYYVYCFAFEAKKINISYTWKLLLAMVNSGRYYTIIYVESCKL